VIGTQGSPYLLPGEWQFAFGYRALNSQQHYQGTKPNNEITSGVVNSQHIVTLVGTYAPGQQWTVSVDVPLVYTGFSFLRPDGDGTVSRDVMRGKGLGDISFSGRYWLLDCEKHQTQNVAVGLGVKVPTGRFGAKDDYRDLMGVRRVLTIDQSIQPGDGGWGIVCDVQAFKIVGNTTFFASGSYLINPRNTNGAPSIIGALGLGSIPMFANEAVNSVPDQYLARAGAVAPIKQVSGLGFSLAGRIEGLPPTDLIGGSDGFRRPGYVVFVEPGFVYSHGAETWSISTPITVHRRVQDSPASIRVEDATIADVVFLFTYSRKFSK